MVPVVRYLLDFHLLRRVKMLMVILVVLVMVLLLILDLVLVGGDLLGL